MGRYCGKLKDFTAQSLARLRAKSAIERSGIEAKEFRSRRIRERTADFRRRALRSAPCRIAGGAAIETPALTRKPAVRVGMQVSRARANGAAGGGQDRAAGGWKPLSQAPFVIRGRDG